MRAASGGSLMEGMEDPEAWSALRTAPGWPADPSSDFQFSEYEERDCARKSRYRRYSNRRLFVNSSDYLSAGSALDNSLLTTVAKGQGITAVTELLEAGASASAQEAGHSRRSALHIACSKRDVRLVKLLLSYGADMEARDILGNRPMDIAAFANAETINALREHSSFEKGAKELSGLLAKVSVANNDSNQTAHPLDKSAADSPTSS